MKHIRNIIVISVASWSGVTTAFSTADPANAAASASSIQYQSPFRDYRPLGEDKPTSWKVANEEVGKIGGWRVYSREAIKASESIPAENPALTPITSDKAAKPQLDRTVKPMPSAHTGHREPK